MPNTQQTSERRGGDPVGRPRRADPQGARERPAPARRDRARRPARPRRARPSTACCRRSQAHGFVEQDRDSGKYQLGAGLLQLGNSYLDLNELRGRSLVHAERLADAHAAPRCASACMHGAERHRRPPRLPPRRRRSRCSRSARSCPLHASALGKAILAFAPEAVVDDLIAEPLPKLTSRTLTASGAARRARRACASAASRASATRRCSASPASPRRSSTTSGHAVGAIGVVGDTERCSRAAPAKGLVAAVTEAARGVSRELGAGRWPGRLALSFGPRSASGV